MSRRDQPTGDHTFVLPDRGPPDTEADALNTPNTVEAAQRELVSLRRANLELQELIGQGGMGEVWRAWDPEMQRTVAVKVLRERLCDLADQTLRFLAEARATGALEHPGVVPVHAVLRLADGRPCYVMREIEGRTLHRAIVDLRADGGATGPEFASAIHRLVRVFERVCRTMAYVHARRVVHRDLKPNNIMLGAFGEVYVVDWGLARALDQAGEGDPWRGTEEVVVGTPAYMAPEQARPWSAPLGPAADVWALGAILYEILAGRPPVRNVPGELLVDRVGRGLVDPVPAHPAVSPELARICERCLQLKPELRPAHGGEVADAVAAWIEGENRRQEALRAVAAADALRPAVDKARARARALQEEARDRLAALPPHAPVEQRLEAWALEDEAARLRRDGEVATVNWTQALQAALAIEPELPEAQERLAEHHRAALLEARRARDADAAARNEALLRHFDRGRHADWLAGKGALSLRTDPSGATVELYRFVAEGRRLRPVFERVLGRTPMIAVDLAPGSWLLRLRIDGRPPVAYPVEVGGDAPWDGCPPGEREPLPVWIPAEGELPPGTVWVPPGPARLGGDLRAPNALPGATSWVDGFFCAVDPVDNRAWLAMLNHLALDRPEVAARCAPVAAGEAYDWTPELPVRWIDAAAAEAYAQWWSARSGVAWVLPGDLQAEKAARGVDGRAFPWGDFLDPQWCNMRDSRPRPGPAPTAAFAGDLSVYGLRGLAGNVRSWAVEAGPLGRLLRGGHFGAAADDCRAAARAWADPRRRDPGIGLRLVVAGPR